MPYFNIFLYFTSVSIDSLFLTNITFWFLAWEYKQTYYTVFFQVHTASDVIDIIEYKHLTELRHMNYKLMGTQIQGKHLHRSGSVGAFVFEIAFEHLD